MADSWRVPTNTRRPTDSTAWTVWKYPVYNTNMEASNTAQAVPLLIYIREVSGLNHGWDTDYLKVCSDLPQFFQANARIVTQLDDRFLRHHFQFSHYHPTIRLFIQSLRRWQCHYVRNKQTNTYVAQSTRTTITQPFLRSWQSLSW
jgi:hypothetical protein